jgi:hypothetical protein
MLTVYAQLDESMDQFEERGGEVAFTEQLINEYDIEEENVYIVSITEISARRRFLAEVSINVVYNLYSTPDLPLD